MILEGLNAAAQALSPTAWPTRRIASPRRSVDRNARPRFSGRLRELPGDLLCIGGIGVMTLDLNFTSGFSVTVTMGVTGIGPHGRWLTGMRAIRVSRFGPPEVLAPTTVADPVAGPGQVVISVEVADVLLLDAVIRSGRAAQWFPVKPPYIPGNGVAGRVAWLGEGVDPAWAGRRVIAHTGGGGGSDGYAEQALVSAEHLVPVPGRLGMQDAAAVLHDGATALGLAAGTGLGAGEWVLVVGAAGGLGLLLIQLARAQGAKVIGAARGAAKLGVISRLGAEAVDYSQPSWGKHIMELTGGTGPGVVFDGAGGQRGREAFDIIAEGGRFSAHGAASGGFAEITAREAKRRHVTVRGIEQVQFRPGQHEQFAQRALSAVAAGQIKPVIGQTFPLEQAAQAHAALEARTATGKTLLTVR
jgi:NADPH2:quinone reductase